MKKKEPLIKIDEVAERLSISKSSIRNHIKSENWDDIPKPKTKIGRSYRWERQELEMFIEGHRAHYKTANPQSLPADFARYI